MPTREGSPTIGTAELFENERVKIWDFVLEPGEALPMHTHRRDHVIVVIEGGDLEVEYEDGRRQAYTPRKGDVHFGQVDGVAADTHDARNVGTTRYRNLIIELKDPAAGVTRLTIVSLNTAHRDEVFAPVRAIDGVELVHADYRVSWEEISARRAGRSLPDPEPLPAELAATLARADVVFGFVIPRDLLALAPRLRWIATPATGVDHLRGTGVLEAAIPVTTVGGLFGPLIAEHVFAVVLALAKRLPHFADQQRAKAWQMSRVTALEGRTIGLVGVGAIGSAVATRARAFGMRTIGLGRSDPRGRAVPGIDRLVSRAELPVLLAAADWVVVAAADTPETRGMIGATELAAMQPSAVLVNVARGSLVDEAALVSALRDGRIAGAALDVFATEPLPAESPLWDLPNVLVTPHVATNVPEYLARAVSAFAANVRRFLDGMPLEHQLRRERGY